MLTLGGYDKQYFKGDLHWTKVSRQGYWEIPMDKVMLGDEDLGISHGAAIDTGTSLIAMPSAEAIRINQKIGAQRNIFGQYLLNCTTLDRLPSLNIVFNGREFPLPPHDYVLNLGADQCLSAFIGLDIPAPAGPLWIVGDAFLRRYYSVYDLGKNAVGLAEAA